MATQPTDPRSTSYFDDFLFSGAGQMNHCLAHIDSHYPETSNLQLATGGALYFARGEGPRLEIRQPFLFWHGRGYRYRYGPLDKGGWHHHWVAMRGPRARRLVESGFAELAPEGYLFIRNPAPLADAFHRIVQLVESGEASALPAEAALLTERILWLAQSDASTAPGGAQTDPHRSAVERLAAAMRKYPQRDWNLEDEARRLHLSLVHLRRLFREYIGRPPHQYLLDWRMHRAAEALRITRQPIARIANRCGYQDPARFSRLFRQYLGLSPRQYRSVAAGAEFR